MVRSLSSKLLLSVLALGFVASCSSNVKRVQIPVGANPNDEMATLESDMTQAKSQQIDVISPASWEHAEKALAEANKKRAKGKPEQEVLESIGEAKAALNDANEKASDSQKKLFDVMATRMEAKNAGADKFYSKDLTNIDSDLKDYTKDYEKGKGTISQKEREALQARYSDLELKSIKSTHLSRAKSMIENAERNDASKLVPKSFATAQAKFKNAEKVIATNRHDQATIENISREVTTEAEKLVNLTKTARTARGLSVEALALDIEGKKAMLNQAGDQIEAREQKIQNQTTQLDNTNKQLREITADNTDLQQEADFNSSFEQAQKSFTPDQADVYRQGDKLLIRLKSTQFPTGSSDLKGSSFPILNKVKDIIGSMKAEQVTVEGHTDSLGGKSTNMKLSQDRAKAVADFLVSSNVIDSKHVDTEGYGYEKPLATNKTKEGRAQNRRVDIIITPSKTE